MSKVQKVFKSRTHILDTLQSQGFVTDDYTGFSLFEVDTMVKTKAIDMLLERTEPTTKKAFVKYILEEKLTPQLINTIVEDIYEINQLLSPQQKDVLIIITDKAINETMSMHIKYLFDHRNVHIIVHEIAALQFNGLKHIMVPSARILTEEETADFMRRYNIADVHTKIPEIGRFDPLAKLICLRPGEVVHLVQFSQTAAEKHSYCVCV